MSGLSKAAAQKFSKVSLTINLRSTCVSELTFENFHQAPISGLTKAAAQVEILKSQPAIKFSIPYDNRADFGEFCLWLKRRYSAKEAYDFKEPTNRSLLIVWVSSQLPTLQHAATHCNSASFDLGRRLLRIFLRGGLSDVVGPASRISRNILATKFNMQETYRTGIWEFFDLLAAECAM